jgi:hypothetical protein
MGEAYRVMGIGNYYLNQAGSGYWRLFKALDYFKKITTAQARPKFITT